AVETRPGVGLSVAGHQLGGGVQGAADGGVGRQGQRQQVAEVLEAGPAAVGDDHQVGADGLQHGAVLVQVVHGLGDLGQVAEALLAGGVGVVPGVPQGPALGDLLDEVVVAVLGEGGDGGGQ